MPNRAAPRTCHHAWMASTLAYDRVDDLRQSEVGRFRFLIDAGRLKPKIVFGWVLRSLLQIASTVDTFVRRSNGG